MIRTSDPRVQAAILASKWAQELSLPIGNNWEPGIQRAIEASRREYGADAEAMAAGRAGLSVSVWAGAVDNAKGANHGRNSTSSVERLP